MSVSMDASRYHGFKLSTEVFALSCGLLVFLYLIRDTLRQKLGLARSPMRNIDNDRGEKGAATLQALGQDTFTMPAPSPYPGWSIESTHPLPYRAFRHGPKYPITLGLRKIVPEEWIELDNHFPKYHADRKSRIEERREKCVRTDPIAYPAAIELLEELADYLPARYPTLYRRTTVGLDNLWSGESFNIVERPLAEDPMAICGRLVQDDLALMLKQPDGQYHLLAGAIILAGFWRLTDKFGMSLSDIHTSGDVPHFREKLQASMLKFFENLKCDTFYSRNNYFIQVDDCLPWSHSIGDEDSPEVSWSTAEKDKAISNQYFRSERQSLRRLPRSGAIVFTIRTYFLPITEMAQEDYVPGRLASGIRSWDDKVSLYKGKEKYESVLLEYLDRQHEEQLARGLDPEREDEVRKYPW